MPVESGAPPYVFFSASPTRKGGKQMYPRQAVSRRGFVGGVAGALGYLGINPTRELWAKEVAPRPWWEEDQVAQDYDSMAKLANNENPWGPSAAVKAAYD